MTREEAISIMNVIIHMLEAQYDTDRIEDAVEMAIKALEQEPTTKNDLGVDAISRQQAIERLKLNFPISQGADNSRDRHRYMQAMADIQAIRELPSVTPQEPQTFKWCTSCREYDQEKHCCHRWSKVIRNAVEEMKQEQEPRKGHWLRRPHVYGVTYCSICDFELKIDNTNYCPHCGAKMESEVDNGNDD